MLFLYQYFSLVNHLEEQLHQESTDKNERRQELYRNSDDDCSHDEGSEEEGEMDEAYIIESDETSDSEVEDELKDNPEAQEVSLFLLN